MEQMTAKERLIDIHEDFHGAELTGKESELHLIVDILEILIDKAERQENHSHNIS